MAVDILDAERARAFNFLMLVESFYFSNTA
jgi:hypothetical protein